MLYLNSHIRFDALFCHVHKLMFKYIYLYTMVKFQSLLKGDTAQHKMLHVAKSMKSFKQDSLYHSLEAMCLRRTSTFFKSKHNIKNRKCMPITQLNSRLSLFNCLKKVPFPSISNIKICIVQHEIIISSST